MVIIRSVLLGVLGVWLCFVVHSTLLCPWSKSHICHETARPAHGNETCDIFLIFNISVLVSLLIHKLPTASIISRKSVNFAMNSC